jgi:hypothetical protein
MRRKKYWGERTNDATVAQLGEESTCSKLAANGNFKLKDRTNENEQLASRQIPAYFMNERALTQQEFQY